MRYEYCPHCGSKCIQKEIGDEGLIPYCPKCQIPLWDGFTTCVICAVIAEGEQPAENAPSEEGKKPASGKRPACEERAGGKEIALLRQDYVSRTNYVCVAGVMKLGESAEDAAVREIKEELGLTVEKLDYIQSYPYEKKDMLMLGFRAVVRREEFKLSGEVDSAEWVKLEDALGRLREGGIAWQLVRKIVEDYGG